MKAINKVRIGLENCECLEFQGDQVSYLAITNIRKNIYWSGSFLFDHNVCDHFSMNLLPSANIKQNDISKFNVTQLPFDRLLQYPDIVSVEVFYSDGRSVDVYVEWEDDNHRDYNLYQRTTISEYGNLCILVDKSKTARDVFDLDYS